VNHLSLKIDSLAHGLHGAARAIVDVRAGTALPQALARQFARSDMTPQARGAIQDLSYLSMRRLGLADGVLALLADKPPQPEILHGLLTCSLSLLLDEENPAYDAFTVIHSPRLLLTAGHLRALDIFCEAAEIDRERARRWAVVRTARAVLWGHQRGPKWLVEAGERLMGTLLD